MDPNKCKSPENLFEITELKGKKTVAIKILPIEDDVSDLAKEIQVLETCSNKNIVKYYGCYSDKINKDFWDIKGGNILLNKEGRVKITDFGVSVKLSNTLSKRNTVIGTPFWMAPEVLRENDYDQKADIWSLGITAIELVVGNPPHSELHPMKAIFVIPTKPEPRLPSNFSKKLRDFVKQCCRKDPKKRPSADDLLKHPFIRSAGSNVILKKLFEQSIKAIENFRETCEVETSRSTMRKTSKMTKPYGDNSSSSEEIDSGTVLINKDELRKGKNSKGDENEANWEDDLQLDLDDDEDDDSDGLYNSGSGTIIVNKVRSKRNPKMEKYDFHDPRPIKENLNDRKKAWYKDTFEAHGKVPKRGHRYAANYYTGLSIGELNEILLGMKKAYEQQSSEMASNYQEERNIVMYAMRVCKGEQSKKIRD